MTDESLARRAATGDRAAFDDLVDRHAASCLRFATRMLGDPLDAEEAVQDAFVRAHRALGRYDGAGTFRTWLFAILINRCRTKGAASARRGRRERRDPIAVSAAVAPTINPALRVELQRAIGKLPDDQREAFLLKHVEQLEYAEMSDVLNVGISALKMRVQRACERLRTELRDYDDAR